MKKVISILSVLFLISTVVNANNVISESEDTLLGSWVFTVNEAPWEYSRGKVVFEKNDENELEGKVIFDTGRQIPIITISLTDESLSFQVNVDGYNVTSFMTLEGDSMTGHVETVEGNMNFSAQREISEG